MRFIELDEIFERLDFVHSSVAEPVLERGLGLVCFTNGSAQVRSAPQESEAHRE